MWRAPPSLLRRREEKKASFAKFPEEKQHFLFFLLFFCWFLELSETFSLSLVLLARRWKDASVKHFSRTSNNSIKPWLKKNVFLVHRFVSVVCFQLESAVQTPGNPASAWWIHYEQSLMEIKILTSEVMWNDITCASWTWFFSTATTFHT